ncbi:MAG: hypothetical protein RLZZ490_1752, partial [Cyanobacteriota bacterium]
MGSSLAARRAGNTPKNRPMPPEMVKDMTIATGEMTVIKGETLPTI